MSAARVIPPRNAYTFLATASGGQQIVYATGSFLPGIWAAPALGAIRNAYNNGDVELVQRRRGDGELDYIAVRRRARAHLDSFFKFPRNMCA